MKSDSEYLKRQGNVTVKRSLYLLFIFISSCFAFFSCHDETLNREDFLIPIDSINLPATVSKGASFDIHFFGTIGISDCYSFKTFNRTMTGNFLTIECFGTYFKNNRRCADQLVTMEGNNLNMSFLVEGTYYIIIKEPDTSTILKQIIVK